jgi:biopolymer transport protein ExbD
MKPIFLIFALIFSSTGLANQTEKGKASALLRFQLLKNGAIRLSGKPFGSSTDLAALKDNLRNIYGDRKSQTGSVDQGSTRATIVEAEPGIKFADLLGVLRALRDSGATPLDLSVEDRQRSFTVSIPVPGDPDLAVSRLAPNPLTLVMAVSANGSIRLNGGAQSSEKAALSRVAQVIRNRKKMKAYRPGSNEVEATLFLKADPLLSYSKVIELLGALKRAGANPLGLRIDD